MKSRCSTGPAVAPPCLFPARRAALQDRSAFIPFSATVKLELAAVSLAHQMAASRYNRDEFRASPSSATHFQQNLQGRCLVQVFECLKPSFQGKYHRDQ